MALAESAGEAVRFRGITRIPVHRSASRGPDDTSHVDVSRVAELLRGEVQRHGWQGLPAACLLSGAATSTQSFLMPPMSKEDMRRALALKLGDTLHFELEQASFDYRRLVQANSQDDAPALTLVASAKIDAVGEAVTTLRRAGLKPVAIGAAAESLANLSQCTSLWDTEESSIHVDIGADSTILNLFEGNLLRFSREIDVAGSAFTSALMRPILTEGGAIELTFDQARQIQITGYPRDDLDAALPFGIRSSDVLPLMEPVAQRLAVEIRRSVDYLCGLLDRTRIDSIVLSGPAGRMRNLDLFLQDNLNTPVVHCDPVARAMSHWRLAVVDENPPDLAGFSAILGYSLGHHQPINLLPHEERLDQLVQRVSGVRKAVVAPVAAAGVCLALAGVPLGRTYDHSTTILTDASARLDAGLSRRDELAAERERRERELHRMRFARGLVPDWTGLMKELSVIVPDQVQITLLSAQSSASEPTLELHAVVHAGRYPFDTVTSRLSAALARSPFFADVHVIEASLGRGDEPGLFEAELSLLAGEDPIH